MDSNITNIKGTRVTICFICQGGSKYEIMASLLAITTRYYNPNINIVVGIPTPFDIYQEPKKKTYELLKKLNINYLYTENFVSNEYKVANKLGLLHKINKEVDTDYILFLDTDILCVGKFIPTQSMYETDMSGVFTDYADTPNNCEGVHWKWLHSKLNIQYEIPKKPIGYSLFSKKSMWAPYLCAGYIFMKKNAEVSNTLNDICYKLYHEIGGRFKNPNNWGGKAAPDQQAIALTINKLKLTYSILDFKHVYSLIPGHYLPNNTNTFTKEYNNFEKKPTHISPLYLQKIQDNNIDLIKEKVIKNLCCRYCYDTFMTDQQFIHYHKPSRVLSMFFDKRLSQILSYLSEKNNLKADLKNKNRNILLGPNIPKKENNICLFDDELYQELLEVILKTTHKDWNHIVHNIS